MATPESDQGHLFGRAVLARFFWPPSSQRKHDLLVGTNLEERIEAPFTPESRVSSLDDIAAESLPPSYFTSIAALISLPFLVVAEVVKFGFGAALVLAVGAVSPLRDDTPATNNGEESEATTEAAPLMLAEAANNGEEIEATEAAPLMLAEAANNGEEIEATVASLLMLGEAATVATENSERDATVSPTSASDAEVLLMLPEALLMLRSSGGYNGFGHQAATTTVDPEEDEISSLVPQGDLLTDESPAATDFHVAAAPATKPTFAPAMMTQNDSSSFGAPVVQSESERDKVFTASDIPSLMQQVHEIQQSGVMDGDKLKYVAQGFRKIMDVENSPPVHEVVKCGALPFLVEMLSLSDTPLVQFEAAWALTNIASTDQTAAIARAGAIPHLVQLLMSTSPDVQKQSVWCIGNIAGDCTELRDEVLASNAMGPLLDIITNPVSTPMLTNCVWALLNFCRGKPQPDLDQVECAIPVIIDILKGNNEDAKADALWALYYISEGSKDRIDAVLQHIPAPQLAQIIDGKMESRLVTPALKLVGNVVHDGNDEQSQMILDVNLLDQMKILYGRLMNMPRQEWSFGEKQQLLSHNTQHHFGRSYPAFAFTTVSEMTQDASPQNAESNETSYFGNSERQAAKPSENIAVTEV